MDIDTVEFDIILKSRLSGHNAHLSTVDHFRVPPELVEKCRRWLLKKGVTCFSTDFGLVCKASRDIFESLFSTKLISNEPTPGISPWRISNELQLPVEIADYVDKITLSARPEFF